MGATDKLRKALDECTVTAGVEHPFECVYITKNAALLYLREIEAENAKLRELVRIMHSELVSCEDNGYVCGGHKFDERVSELGIEADE